MDPRNLSFAAVASLVLAGLLLAGCGTSPSAAPVTGSTVVATQRTGGVSGMVHGGQQPVASAHLYLYAAASTGYGQPATSLLTTGSGVQFDGNGNGYVVTDSNGQFNITGDYVCPNSTSLIYMLASGGNPGLAAGTNNAAITLVSVLGNCSAVKANAANLFVTVNELSTVAAAYALAGFAASSTQIGSSSTNLSGITNSFTTATILGSIATGTSPLATPAGNGVIPQAELYTLADILAACVNSDGTVTCPALFAATKVNGVAPSDIFQAVLNIAHNPGSNVSALMQLLPSQGPFQPTLSSTPNDWTVAIHFTGNGLATPQAIAVDASGNAWVANATNTVTELSAATGAPLSGASGFSATGLDAPVSLAIDTTGQVWIVNCGDPCSGSGNPGSVTILAGNGQSSVNVASSGLSGPYAIALSGANDAWVANSLGSSLTKLSSTGVTSIPAAIAADLIYPVSVAISPAGNAVTVSPADNAIVAFSPSGNPDSTDSFQGSALNFPYAVAFDHAGNIWVANHGNNSVAVMNGGSAVGSSPYSGGGITNPTAIALDGTGTAWVTNTSGSVSNISNPGAVLSPSTGLRNDLIYPNGVAVDASGNVWVSNCGQYCQPSSASSGSVAMLVGAAAPVITPLSVAAANSAIGTRP